MPARLVSIIVIAALSACGGGSSESGPASVPQRAPNQAPVAHAMVAGTVVEGATVVLDGTASADPEGELVSFAWRQTSGIPVVVDAASSATASFAAPQVEETSRLTFELAVTDTAGASGFDQVTVQVEPGTFVLSGTITASRGTAVDEDLNDWNAPRRRNDDAASAQALTDPMIVTGYLNVAGAGEQGPSSAAGDVSDFFRVELSRGQGVSLIAADPERGDPDLYLWDAAGTTVLDASVDDGPLDGLTVPADATYLVEVAAYRGATNYTLVFAGSGEESSSSGMRLSDEFIPGDVILERSADDARIFASAAEPLMAGLRMPRVTGRPVLGHLVPEDDGLVHAADGGDIADARGRAVEDPVTRHKLRTLLTIKTLRRRQGMVYAQPNYRVHAQAVPGDPAYPRQWHYSMIGLPAAWTMTSGDPAVTVAVVDSGVLSGHPDLAGQLLPGYDFVAAASASGDGDGLDADPADPGSGVAGTMSSFHGTHVAGTVAAVAGNGIGGTGAAPGVKVRPVRVLGTTGGSSYDILQGIRYAAGLANDSGSTIAAVDVINLSLGRRGPCWPAEQAAFDAVREAGVLVVAAAGNDGLDAGDAFPANCGHVVAVGALDKQGNRAPYSNFGPRVDLYAPGGRPDDADGDGDPDGVLSLTGDDRSSPLRFSYGFKHGTSMASPHVAAVAALMKSLNPALTPDEFDELLLRGHITDTAGMIDAQRAALAALYPPALPPAGEPYVTVAPRAFDFASVYNYSEVDVYTTNGSTAELQLVTADGAWLHVAPVGDAEPGVQRYGITVHRAGLAPGTYSAVLVAGTGEQAVEVPVSMRVSGAAQGDAGHLYVLLKDPASGRVVHQVEVKSLAGRYTYAFPEVHHGTYELIAGSDADNDLAICDPGESCGAWSGEAQAGTTLVVGGPLSGLDFVVEPRVTLPLGGGGAQRAIVRALAEGGSKQLN